MLMTWLCSEDFHPAAVLAFSSTYGLLPALPGCLELRPNQSVVSMVMTVSPGDSMWLVCVVNPAPDCGVEA